MKDPSDETEWSQAGAECALTDHSLGIWSGRGEVDLVNSVQSRLRLEGALERIGAPAVFDLCGSEGGEREQGGGAKHLVLCGCSAAR